MVFEWNDEFCKVILRKNINSEPYEVIDIMDLLEAWRFYKTNKTKSLIEESQEAYFQGYQEGREYERKQLEARFDEQFGKIKPQTCSTCKFEWFEPECDSCSEYYSNWQPKGQVTDRKEQIDGADVD